MGRKKRGGNRPKQYSRRVRARLEAVELFPELAEMALADFEVNFWDRPAQLKYPKVFEWSMQFDVHTPGLFRHKFNELARVYGQTTE